MSAHKALQRARYNAGARESRRRYFSKYPNFSRAFLTTSWLGALTMGNLSFHS